MNDCVCLLWLSLCINAETSITEEGSQRSCLVEVKTPDLVVMVGGINPSEMLSKRTVL